MKMIVHASWRAKKKDEGIEMKQEILFFLLLSPSPFLLLFLLPDDDDVEGEDEKDGEGGVESPLFFLSSPSTR